MILENENIICLSPNKWKGLWRNRQQIMFRLAKKNKIFFIETQRDYDFSFFVNFKKNFTNIFKFSFKKTGKNLIVIDASPFLPLLGNIFSSVISNILAENLQRVNNWLLAVFIKRTIKHFKIINPIFFVYNPLQYELVMKFNKGIICYYVYDELTQYPQNKRIKKTLNKYDCLLSQRADIIFASSFSQFQKRKYLNKETYLIKNGVDFNHFSKALDRDLEIPSDIKEIKHPIIGYLGYLGFQININLLIQMGKTHPEWSIVLVGPDKLPRDENYQFLKRLKNVLFLGKKEVQLLPKYLKAFDVAIMPYDLTTHVVTSFPLKLYEYLAAGKSIVSMNLNCLNYFKGVIKVASCASEFVIHIEDTLIEQSKEKINKGIEIAKQNDWNNRVEKISELINNELNERNNNSDKIGIVHFLDLEWEKDHRRPHIEALSKHCKVVCIESPLTILMPFLKIKTFWKWVYKKKNKKNKSIYFYRPFMFVPYSISYRFTFLEQLNRFLLKLSLQKIKKILKNYKLINFITCPQQSCVLDTLCENIVCFDCYDAYSKHPRLSQKVKNILSNVEMNVLRKTNIVFTTAKSLYKDKIQVNSNTYYIPNSADVEFFMANNKLDIDTLEDFKSIPKPLIGLIGNINEIIDVDLLSYLADRHPEWSIVLIGAVNGGKRFKKSKKLKRLKDYSNVHFLGRKRYEELPAYQREIDVCLLPYLINEYTNCIHPNKIYQYLAQEKQIVSTNLNEVEHLKDVIKIAKSYKDFECYVDRALNFKLKGYKNDELLNVALKNSIHCTAQRKIEIINNYIRKSI